MKVALERIEASMGCFSLRVFVTEREFDEPVCRGDAFGGSDELMQLADKVFNVALPDLN